MLSKIDVALRNSKTAHVKRIRRNGTLHLLILGDCREVLRQIPDGSVDLIITDPPYNVGLDYGGHNDRMKWHDYYLWAESWLAELPRVMSDKASIYLIGYPEINARFLIFLENKGLILRRWLTWHYPTNIGHSKRNFTRSQRSILFMTKSDKYVFNKENVLQPYLNPDVSKIKKLIARGNKGRGSYDFLENGDVVSIIQTSFDDALKFNLLKNVSRERFTQWKDGKEKGHPCQLPSILLNLLIRVSSNPGAVVLDPFGGTFTTSKAAEDGKRNSVGIELNPKYVDFGLRRLKS